MKKFFLFILLIILVCITNNVSAQFVPFQSGHFKRLAADTLYNLTDCGAPAVTPNSYRRVVWYYDSCNQINYYWQPENQVWATIEGGGGGDTTLTWEQTLNNQGAIPFAAAHNTDMGYNSFTLDNLSAFNIYARDQADPINSGSNLNMGTIGMSLGGYENNAGGVLSIGSGLFQHYAFDYRLTDSIYTNNFITGLGYFKFVKDKGSSVSFPSGISPNAKIIYASPDTMSGSPEFFYVSDNDTIKKYPFASSPADIRDTAYLLQGYGTLINNLEGYYKPNGLDVLIAVDTSVIATKTDITIITNSDTAIFIVDSISNAPPPGAVDGNDYLVGTSPTGLFAGHANEIAELIGGVYSFTVPTSQQQLIVDNAVTYATYQFNGTIWVQTSVLWRVGGNRAIGQNAFIGRVDKAPYTMRAWNKPVLRLDTTRDVKFYKFVGTRPGNYAFFDSTTGNIDTGFFRPLIEGANITITPGPIGDTISSTGGGGSALAAQAGYTLHGTGTGVYEDAIIFKDTAKAWVGLNTTAPASVLDIYPTFPGTVTTTSASQTVTGSGTRFLSNFKNGDSILVNGTYRIVLAIASNTSLTTTAVFGANNTNIAYTNPGAARGVFGFDEAGRGFQYGLPLFRASIFYRNTAFGVGGLASNTTGTDNTAFGRNSLTLNTTGTDNTAFGSGVLVSTTTGGFNTAYGSQAMFSNTTGTENTALGAYAMNQNTSGDHNIAVGQTALYGINAGFGNTGVGFDALRLVFNGTGNTAVGYEALRTTGGNGNTAVGYDAVRYPSASEVTAIGHSALRDFTGNSSTALGYIAGMVSRGSNNIFIGSRSGQVHDFDLVAGSSSGSNTLVIGTGASVLYNESNAANIFNTIWIDANNGTDSTASTTSRVGINNTTPAASAALDITSTTTGFLPPRMTATQASAISSPAEGLLVYVTDTNGTFTSKGWWGWNGAAWEKLNN